MDLQELEKYRPIPKGGWKLLLTSLLVAAICIGFSLVVWSDESVTVFGRVVAIVIVMIAVGVLLAKESPAILWLCDYWRRNVRGYTLWGWRDEKDEVRWELALILPYDLAIGVALGGWFRRSRIVCSAVTFREGVNSKEMLSEWRVKLVQIHACTQTIIVRLVDSRGDRVTVNAKDALEILERFSARLEAIGNGWQDVVRHGLIYERVRTEERDEAKAETKAIQEELRRVESLKERYLQITCAWNATACELGVRLADSARFIKSKQGKAIREWLRVRHNELDLAVQGRGNAGGRIPATTEAREGG